ncbi:lactoylglutathione lyase [Chlorella sorokiniana]|uniref:Lactoylglutathione lyase n=1 Tax=Chlorella sorokiniana TaxID=3076 RepID=A0A2P6TCB8_CHLSO|nr:lactoylglutathione lyase [Chlorella sorokiniana]|eukprot:PRW20252.1 lactoylglutathione lyase [Chlorella sorokiniana]
MVGKLNSDAAAATAAAAAGPKSGQALADQIVQRAREGGAQGEPDYEEQEAHDFSGQAFVKCKPLMKLVGEDNPQVLGFREIPRPDLGFPGHWLKGLGLMIHIIQNDPQVPRRHPNWKNQEILFTTLCLQEQYSREPEAWFIRRGSHLAIEVEDFEQAEQALRRHGVEYSRFVLPDVDMKQLFCFDPEGNGIELGQYADTWRFLRERGEGIGWL